jgi:hypothetical protein
MVLWEYALPTSGLPAGSYTIEFTVAERHRSVDLADWDGGRARSPKRGCAAYDSRLPWDMPTRNIGRSPHGPASILHLVWRRTSCKKPRHKPLASDPPPEEHNPSKDLHTRTPLAGSQNLTKGTENVRLVSRHVGYVVVGLVGRSVEHTEDLPKGFSYRLPTLDGCLVVEKRAAVFSKEVDEVLGMTTPKGIIEPLKRLFKLTHSHRHPPWCRSAQATPSL